MARNREARRILAVAALLAVMFALAARLTPWRAELAESNFQANLIRLQAFLFGPKPAAVLVGSSLSGRLLPSYFQKTPLAPLANLGLDGSGPLYGLELALRRPPPVVLIEANTLLRAPDENDAAIDAAVRGVQFRLSKYLPIMRAEERPSSMLYNWIKAGQKGEEAPTATNSPKPEVQSPKSEAPASNIQYSTTPPLRHSNTASDSGINPLSAGESNRERLRAQIKALRAGGSRVVIVRLPTGYLTDNDPNFALGLELAREFKLPEFDLAAECSSRGQTISYSDRLHLAPGSAREVSRLIATLVAQTEARAEH